MFTQVENKISLVRISRDMGISQIEFAHSVQGSAQFFTDSALALKTSIHPTILQKGKQENITIQEHTGPPIQCSRCVIESIIISLQEEKMNRTSHTEFQRLGHQEEQKEMVAGVAETEIRRRKMVSNHGVSNTGSKDN